MTCSKRFSAKDHMQCAQNVCTSEVQKTHRSLGLKDHHTKSISLNFKFFSATWQHVAFANYFLCNSLNVSLVSLSTPWQREERGLTISFACLFSLACLVGPLHACHSQGWALSNRLSHAAGSHGARTRTAQRKGQGGA